MYIKNRPLFLFLIFFSLFFGDGFCASKTINSLSLDFTDETYSEVSGRMTGKITYNKYPYSFVFQTFEPEKQILFQNEQGTFYIENETIIDISEEADFLTQTCTDFLNWFKDDYGLRESSFEPEIFWTEDGAVLSRWDFQKKEAHPIDTVIVQSDSQGRFTELSMFVDMESKTPVTKTSLSDFEYNTGFSYPTKIVSVSYEGETQILKKVLSFSNIKFNNADTKASVILALPDADLSTSRAVNSPSAPEEKSYRVSIPSVLVGTSFKFYKKFITNQDMTNCPFSPSCSQYMMEAVTEHGVGGFFMGLERLKRCTSTEHKRDLYPTLSNGKHYDPVPPKKVKEAKK